MCEWRKKNCDLRYFLDGIRLIIFYTLMWGDRVYNISLSIVLLLPVIVYLNLYSHKHNKKIVQNVYAILTI